MKNEQPEEEMYKDPKNWKWTFFYFNRKDERLFLPKKNKSLGSTMNFANPKAYLIFFPIAFMIILGIFVVIKS